MRRRLEVPTSGGTAFDRPKAVGKTARAAALDLFSSPISARASCTRCAKKCLQNFIAAFDLVSFLLRLAAPLVGFRNRFVGRFRRTVFITAPQQRLNAGVKMQEHLNDAPAFLYQKINQTDRAENAKEGKCKIWMRSEITRRDPIRLFALAFWKPAVKIGNITGYNSKNQRYNGQIQRGVPKVILFQQQINGK